jgi:AP-1 complex subunit mu
MSEVMGFNNKKTKTHVNTIILWYLTAAAGTDTNMLKEYIKTESNTQDSKKDKENEIKITKTLTNVVNWRKDNIHYEKNEVYLDVIEKVNSIVYFILIWVDCNANVVRSEVLGEVKVKSYLSGMPTLKLGINDKLLYELTGKAMSRNKAIDMEDLKFHQCVDMNKFESSRAIEFIPPDGEFYLMKYRLNMQLKPLMWVEIGVENISTTKIEFTVIAKSNYKSRSIASNVDIFIPVPNDLLNATFKVSSNFIMNRLQQVM